MEIYVDFETEAESVALLGAHTLGRAMTNMSGFEVQLLFDDDYNNAMPQ